MNGLLLPLLLAVLGVYALSRRIDLFSAMLRGAKDGMKLTVGLLPSLIVLFSGISALRASGALDALSRLLAPVLSVFGLPAELLPMMLLRPLSGSGALSLGSELISRFGPDSFLGRCAAVMLGSTETTFYVLAVYFGAAGIKKIRRAVPSALAADLVGFLLSVWTVRLFFQL